MEDFMPGEIWARGELAFEGKEEHTKGIGGQCYNTITMSPELFPNLPKKKSEQLSEVAPVEMITNIEPSAEKVPVVTVEVGHSDDDPTLQGWMTNGGLSDLLGRSNRSVQAIAEKYRVSNPGWFTQYKNNLNHTLTYYSPELVRAITLEFESRTVAPEGWMTNGGLRNQLWSEYRIKTDAITIERILRSYKESHQEDFRNYEDKNTKRIALHYSPELVSIVISELQNRKQPPDNWITKYGLSGFLEAENIAISRSVSIIEATTNKYRSTNPEWFQIFYSRGGGVTEYYSPELVTAIISELGKRIPAPDGWQTNNFVSKKLAVGNQTVKTIAESYRASHPEWFQRYTIDAGQEREHYSPELVSVISQEINREHAPEGWMHQHQLAAILEKELGRDMTGSVHRMAESYRSTNPEWFQRYKIPRGHEIEYLSPKLVRKIFTELSGREIAPTDWITNSALSKKLKVGPKRIAQIVGGYRKSNPEYFKDFVIVNGAIREHYSPELVFIVEKILEAEIEYAPDGWLTVYAISNKLDTHPKKIQKYINELVCENELVRKYKDKAGSVRIHYAPELVSRITEIVLAEKEQSLVQEKEIEEKTNLENQCDTFFQDVARSKGVEFEEFKKLLSLFGTSSFVDILYRYRPEFKRLEVEYIKGSLAKYLGDFLIMRTGIVVDDLEVTLPYLSDISLQETLTEIIKKECLSYYHQKKRETPECTDVEIVREYIWKLKDKTSSFADEILTGIIEQVKDYYTSLLGEDAKPESVVEFLRIKRPFPDINQKLNIKEIKEKKKVLIGDEMGMGKSASAILAKEYLGTKKALVVVPSNVISTWQSYLSDQISSTGAQVGYFKKGNAPKVLVIENPMDLQGLERSEYDYYLISQEKLNERYTNVLKALQCDMVIIDEVHKLKNITTGQRSKAALDILTKVGNEDPYVVLLSGTPIPNKVGDVAVLLKLLYPDRFRDIEDFELVTSIIHGDITDIRSLLIPRMQMKALHESVQMPEKTEMTLFTELSPLEKEVYELILEDDDLTASQKIQLMRRFVMNPASVDATPNIESSKIIDTQKHLQEAFLTKDKVVLIVNSYIEGIVTGENSILKKFNLPPDVSIRIISGAVSKAERDRIQDELLEMSGKILLVVSGQTADVGVDFSAAEHMIFYNDPWTKFDKQQQIARVYRPGLNTDLTVATSVTKGTIEEGIAEYIELKYAAIQKILKGVPLTEIEKGLLTTAEKQTTIDIEGDLEIAREWLSSPQNKLHKFFGATREIGEAKFHQFLLEYGEEYAQYYLDMGGRGFQANTSRIAGTLIETFIKEKNQNATKTFILDSASGPEMLRTHIEDYLKDSVVSLDINQNHFLGGDGRKREGTNNTVTGSFVSLPFKDKAFDYVNMSLAFHYTKLDLRKNEYERLKVLAEMNRVLKLGGRAIISMVYSLELKDPQAFRECAETFGFHVVEEVTGTVSFGKTYAAPCIVLEKIEHIDSVPTTVTKGINKKKLNGLKFKSSTISALKNSRVVLDRFLLNDMEFEIPLNTEDKTRLNAQQSIFDEGHSLIEEYGSIKNIPNEEIVERNFLRIRMTKGTDKQTERYRLFKKSPIIGGFVEVLAKT